jgi:hypothetical protein
MSSGSRSSIEKGKRTPVQRFPFPLSGLRTFSEALSTSRSLDRVWQFSDQYKLWQRNPETLRMTFLIPSNIEGRERELRQMDFKEDMKATFEK